MRVSGGDKARVKPHVVCLTLSDHVEPASVPGSAAPEQQPAGGRKVPRDSWTRPDGQHEPLDQLSITGMSLVFNPRAFWLRRAIWLAIIICLLVWLCLQLRICVQRLSAGGTVRTWARRTVSDIPLPAITVCHGNGFKKSVVLRHQTGNASWPRWHQSGYGTLNWTSFNGLNEFYAAATYNWNDMVLVCRVDARDCSEIGTFLTVSTILNGLCTTFITNITVAKRLASAQVILVLQEHEALDEFEHSGWKVFLHPQAIAYNDFLFFSGLVATVNIFGNRIHQVKTFRRITEELPKGAGKGCNTTADALVAQRQCLGSCMMDGMATEAANVADNSAPLCSVPWVPKTAYQASTPSCRTLGELERSSMGTHRGVSEQTFLAWTANCACTPPCRADQYQIEEHEKWHIEETAIYLSHPRARGQTVGAVRLWLSDVEEHITEREAYSFDAFIADVGGNFGLMLGGSLLTFVEIVDCVIASCLSRRQKKASRAS